MRIAFVSYELPPDTALGGIATYVAQIADALADAGADVEVFCGSTTRTDQTTNDHGVVIHRLKIDRHAFATAIVPVFLQRHRAKPFDVLEGPDFNAEARYIVRALPQLPYVVKLHTPYYFAAKVGKFPYSRTDFWNQMRLYWYALKTRNFHALSTREEPIFAEEKQHLLGADEIAAPTHAVADVVCKTWGADFDRVSLVPYTYEPPAEMTAIPIDTDTQVITFLGRLEWRKGVQDLTKAFPIIFDRHPNARFRFVGAWSTSPLPGLSMKDYVCRGLAQKYLDRIEFVGKVPLNQISQYLAKTDICVFPSRWESFGFVVLEAMSAGRGVVCTGNGGMAELVGGGKYGLLVPPKSPLEIAKQINHFLDHPKTRKEMGALARTEGLKPFASSTVIPKQLASYERAIARRKKLMQHAG
jgi:glycosyltransferase involved in cell wall biosynthesis